MIDQQTVQRIKDTANIVEVVSEFVTLRKSGMNYKGLCPFHDEKTPSFMVTPSRGICHCFGCGKGGNPVSFIMEHEQMSYVEALRWLAKKYNIEIVERELSNEERERQSERESMFIVNEWTAKHFESELHNTPDGVAIGMQYFRSRGFRDDIIRKFQLGYDGKDRYALAREAKNKGYNDTYLEKNGTCYRTDKGELIDRFADRVIFPWFTVSGKVVGFSGRLLVSATKGVTQKYVNSPDSEIFHKGNELYGILQAKKAIGKEGRVFMVEGQTDVISMHQCGIENVVANSGTALSLQQIRILRRFTTNITLLYDGDAAGIHAALRGTDMLLSEGMNVKVLFLPDGDDPDSFARKHTAEEFRKYVDEHQTDFLDFKTQILLREAKDAQQRTEAISSIVESISLIPNQILRDTYLHNASATLGIHETSLMNSMNQMIRDRKEGKSTSTSSGAALAGNANQASKPQNTGGIALPGGVQKLLAQHIVKNGEYVLYDNVEDDEGNIITVNVAQFIAISLNEDSLKLQSELYQRILDECVDKSNTPDFKAETYFFNHEDITLSRIAMALTQERYIQHNADENAENVTDNAVQKERQTRQMLQQTEHLLLDFRMEYINERLTQIKQDIALSSTDPERLSQLMTDYQNATQLRNALAQRLGKSVVH